MMAIKTQEKKGHGNRYSDKEKAEILDYYDENGFTHTLTKFEIGHTTLINWIKKRERTPTPKRDIIEEIMQRRKGLSGSKQITPTPTTPTPTPTISITPTTPAKIKGKESSPKSNEIAPTPIFTPTLFTSTPTTPTPTTPTPTIKSQIEGPQIKSLTFEQIVEKLIACSKSSSLRDNKMIAKAFEGKGNNPSFQSKRIKDAVRLLLDSGIKFVQEEN